MFFVRTDMACVSSCKVVMNRAENRVGFSEYFQPDKDYKGTYGQFTLAVNVHWPSRQLPLSSALSGPKMTKIKKKMRADTVWMPRKDWHDRFNSLKNVPPIFQMVWEAAPGVLAATLLIRVTAAVLPLGMLMVTRRIIDAIYVVTSQDRKS